MRRAPRAAGQDGARPPSSRAAPGRRRRRRRPRPGRRGRTRSRRRRACRPHHEELAPDEGGEAGEEVQQAADHHEHRGDEGHPDREPARTLGPGPDVVVAGRGPGNVAAHRIRLARASGARRGARGRASAPGGTWRSRRGRGLATLDITHRSLLPSARTALASSRGGETGDGTIRAYRAPSRRGVPGWPERTGLARIPRSARSRRPSRPCSPPVGDDSAAATDDPARSGQCRVPAARMSTRRTGGRRWHP